MIGGFALRTFGGVRLRPIQIAADESSLDRQVVHHARQTWHGEGPSQRRAGVAETEAADHRFRASRRNHQRLAQHPVTPRDAQRALRQIVFPNHIQRVALAPHLRRSPTARRNFLRLVLPFPRDRRAAAGRGEEQPPLAELRREIIQRSRGRSKSERQQAIRADVTEPPSVGHAFQFVGAGQQVRRHAAVARRVAQGQQARLRRGGVSRRGSEALQQLLTRILSRAEGELRVAKKRPVPGRMILRPRLDLQAQLDRLADM